MQISTRVVSSVRRGLNSIDRHDAALSTVSSGDGVSYSRGLTVRRGAFGVVVRRGRP